MDPAAIRERVDARLQRFFDEKREEAAALAPESVELVEAIFELTLRGGKRLRPIVIAAAHRAIDPAAEPGASVEVGASIEMLQTFLLIHDDWMDRDEDRRGGKSVWAALRDRHQDAHLGGSLAILAGDLAAVYAHELLLRAPFPDGKQAADAFHRMEREVFFGQQLDLIASENVERMYDLKTASYTTRGPMRLGALLGDARPEQLAALDRLAGPLGVAFQLRDELLGTFGDPSLTGKPAGNDLRAGKHTVLIEELRARGTTAQIEAVLRVLGRGDTSDADVLEATDALVASGAKARVEERLGARIAEARAELGRAPIDPAPLSPIIDQLAFRDR